MQEAVRKRLRGKLDEVVFIELKKDIHIPGKEAVLRKNIPIPILVKRLANRVTQNDYDELSVKEMTEGMVEVVAIDSEFIHREYYKSLLIGLDEGMTRILTGTAIKHAEENRLEDAFVYFETAIILDASNLDAAYNKAKVCEALSHETVDPEMSMAWENEAFALMEKLTVDFADFNLPYYHLGFHYSNNGLHKKAELAWEHFIESSDDENKIMEVQEMLIKIRDRIIFDEGYNEILAGAFETGLEKLLKLEDANPSWWNLLFFIALAYRNLGKIETAVEYFERVIRMKPDQAESLNELGLCYSVIGNKSESARYFKKALNMDPENSEMLCNNAMAQMEMGNMDLAETYLNRSMELNPNDSVTIACMDELNKFKNN
jgi:tetratricopeptide (TPR) repeat protein